MISDEHVALVRALLLADEGQYSELRSQVQHQGVRASRILDVLLSAVFQEAVRHRFGPDATRADVIRFVARCRVDGALKETKTDILVAERLLLAFLRNDQGAGVDDLDPAYVSILVADLLLDLLPFPPDEDQIDEVLTAAKTRADLAMRQVPR